MRKKLIISSIILIVLFTFVACELFLEKPSKPTIYALLVGIDYKNTKPSILSGKTPGALEGTIADAEELAAALSHRGAKMGNSVKVTLMIQEGSESPTHSTNTHAIYPNKTNIITQIKRIANLISENDTFLFYYAGHGYGPTSNLGYLVPAASVDNQDVNDIDPLSTKELRKELKEVKGTKILILDSCYSGAHEVDYPRSFASRQGDSDDFIYDYDSSQFYLLASSAQELAWETTHEDHHGYLTLLLLESLGWAHDKTSDLKIYDPDSPSGTKPVVIKGNIPKDSKAPVEQNGTIMIGDIFSYVSRFRNSKGQTPQTGRGPLDLVLFSRHW